MNELLNIFQRYFVISKNNIVQFIIFLNKIRIWDRNIKHQQTFNCRSVS